MKLSKTRKKADSFCLIRLMTEWSGFTPRMWEASIVGFGSYQYCYASGREGDIAGNPCWRATCSVSTFSGRTRRKRAGAAAWAALSGRAARCRTSRKTCICSASSVGRTCGPMPWWLPWAGPERLSAGRRPDRWDAGSARGRPAPRGRSWLRRTRRVSILAAGRAGGQVSATAAARCGALSPYWVVQLYGRFSRLADACGCALA